MKSLSLFVCCNLSFSPRCVGIAGPAALVSSACMLWLRLLSILNVAFIKICDTKHLYWFSNNDVTLMIIWLPSQTKWLALPWLTETRLYIISSSCRWGGRRHANVYWCLCCCCAAHQVSGPGVASSPLLFCSIQQLPDWLTGLLIIKTQQIEWVGLFCWSLSIVVFAGLAHLLRWLKIETGWISVNSWGTNGGGVCVCLCVC